MLPESFKKSVNAMLEAGWDKVGIDEALGHADAQGSGLGAA